jgi:DNA-binding FadR family transcriptional regulator
MSNPLLARIDAGDDLHEPRLRDRLAARFADEIVSGRMAAGEAFPSVDEIGQKYKISRTVARETVQTLSMLGLLRVQHGRRTEILPPEEWDVLSSVVQGAIRRGQSQVGRSMMRDLYAFRLMIEPQTAAWAAERADESELKEVCALTEHMSALAHGHAPPEAVMAADRDFHDRLARASGNVLVTAVSRDFREVLTTLWTLSHVSAEEVRQVAEQHEAITAAISRRDPEGAADAMREHLAWASRLDLGALDGARPAPSSRPPAKAAASTS